MDFLQFRLGLGEYFVSGGTKRTADEIENSDDENANVIGNERKKRRVPATLPLALARFRVKYRTGSLLPTPDSGYKFLHIYFMGDSARQVDTRCAHNNSVKRPIVEQLQTFFHQHNGLVALFKTVLDRMPSDNHKIVIRAVKTPAGQHARRFNAPTIDAVAIVVVGENLENRDIVLHRRNDQLQRVSETYDALQYPTLFWQGEDGYNFAMKLINPVIGNGSYFVLESKAADPNIKKKRGLWEELAEKMRKAGYLRSPSKLRDFRWKQAAKTSITRFKKEQRKMEGGPGSLERETPLIWIGQFIMFAPIDFEKDVSAFDSDYFRDDVWKIAVDKFNNVKMEWKKICDHVTKIEDDYLQREHIVDEVQELIIRVGYDTDSSTDFFSESEDEVVATQGDDDLGCQPLL
ncbi:hypothetical protein GEV33_007712 [Tenebrio molitor]|uniref:Uncharacterized protein n=1 Tax=Tenebrio molitor TaxID=7067 RepID=A0A8J6LCT3_TENMO|nr:hypothetical protein GEV33_007712 [Tenebrio molitor]